MGRFLYTVLDGERNEIIGFVEADRQSEALEICRMEFNTEAWDERFPFHVDASGGGLYIRPHYDKDPYFTDHNATMIENPTTYRHRQRSTSST